MKKKILILDDSPLMLKIIGDMLTTLHYDVTPVDNGIDACRKIESTRYDMIITDMNMPIMDGLEFTRQIRTYPNCKFVPIVMLSSEKSHEKIARAKNLGVATFLSKPPKESQLRAILQIILSKRGTQRIPVQLKVFYGDNETLSGHTENISVGGLFLKTKNPLSPGDKLSLKFSLPENNYPISCRGRVAWVYSPGTAADRVHPSGMGVEFLNLQGRRQLEEFLKTVARKN